MSTFPCKRGCTNPQTKRPLWHSFDLRAPPGYSGRAAKYCPLAPESAGGPEATPAPTVAAAPTPPPSEPKAAPPPPPAPKPGLLQRLTFTGRTATVESSKTVAANQVVSDFYVDAPHTLAFVNMGYTGLRWVTHTVDDWLEIPHIPDKFFVLSDFQKASIESDPKLNWYTRGVTWLMKRLGAKNREEAHGLIDGLDFFGHFGGLFAVIVKHYMDGVRDSPKLKKRKQEAEARAAERARLKAQGLREVSAFGGSGSEADRQPAHAGRAPA
jgi:hypothetical protein